MFYPMRNHFITSVPAANFSISKTPIGPFQMTVCVVSRASLKVLIESGTMSSMPDAGTTYKHPHYILYSEHKALARSNT